MSANVRPYVDILGFTEATWRDDAFTCMLLDAMALCRVRGHRLPRHAPRML